MGGERGRPWAGPLGAVAVLVTVAVSGCGGNGPDAGGWAPDTGTGVRTVSPSPGPDGVTVLALSATDRLTLTPGSAVVAPGNVTVTVRNTGAMSHEVSLVELATGRTLARGGLLRPGSTVTMPVRLTTPGDYEVRCGFHPGMTASLTVR